MNEILTTYKQQSFNDSASIEIRQGGVVTINGTLLTTHREKALANIILRLNAYRKIVEEEKKKKDLTPTK